MFLFADQMTQYTCHTPKFWTVSKGDKTIETRIVGIEVVCGPIKTVLVYRTDELVSGGANITIEMTRQAMIDVSILLRKRGLLVPRILDLQFDNCGDNKNKEIFGFYCVLIESWSFDEIEIAFLIVGHTHASIDQYFSVISKAKKKTVFIGTPMAFLELIRRCHDASWQQRAIKVYYDMKSFFAPYINKKSNIIICRIFIKWFLHLDTLLSASIKLIVECRIGTLSGQKIRLQIWIISLRSRNPHLFLFLN
jgi:hypothetical protein